MAMRAYFSMTSPTDRRFLYRADALDPDLAQKLARARHWRRPTMASFICNIARPRARLRRRASEDRRLFDRRRLRAARRVGRDDGLAHASDVSAGAIRRAAETRSRCSIPRSRRPPAPQRTNRHLYDEANPRPCPLREEGRLPPEDRRRYARAIRASCRCRSRSRVAGSAVEIVRADGFLATDIRPPGSALNVSIVVEENGRSESGYFGLVAAICTIICSKRRSGTARSTRR